MTSIEDAAMAAAEKMVLFVPDEISSTGNGSLCVGPLDDDVQRWELLTLRPDKGLAQRAERDLRDWIADAIVRTCALSAHRSDGDEPVAWIVSCPAGHEHDHLLFGDRVDAEQRAELFNDDLPEGESNHTAEPLYRRAAPPVADALAPAQAEPDNVFDAGVWYIQHGPAQWVCRFCAEGYAGPVTKPCGCRGQDPVPPPTPKEPETHTGTFTSGRGETVPTGWRGKCRITHFHEGNNISAVHQGFPGNICWYHRCGEWVDCHHKDRSGYWWGKGQDESEALAALLAAPPPPDLHTPEDDAERAGWEDAMEGNTGRTWGHTLSTEEIAAYRLGCSNALKAREYKGMPISRAIPNVDCPLCEDGEPHIHMTQKGPQAWNTECPPKSSEPSSQAAGPSLASLPSPSSGPASPPDGGGRGAGVVADASTGSASIPPDQTRTSTSRLAPDATASRDAGLIRRASDYIREQRLSHMIEGVAPTVLRSTTDALICFATSELARQDAEHAREIGDLKKNRDLWASVARERMAEQETLAATIANRERDRDAALKQVEELKAKGEIFFEGRRVVSRYTNGLSGIMVPGTALQPGQSFVVLAAPEPYYTQRMSRGIEVAKPTIWSERVDAKLEELSARVRVMEGDRATPPQTLRPAMGREELSKRCAAWLAGYADGYDRGWFASGVPSSAAYRDYKEGYEAAENALLSQARAARKAPSPRPS